MKRLFVYVLSAALLCACSVGYSQTTFTYTGTVQTYTVPAGVTAIAVDVWGARGGGLDCGTPNPYQSLGGCGGRVQATINVTPGHVLDITVGEQPIATAGGGGYISGAGGYGGGGKDPAALYSATWPGAGGGGATTITDATTGATLAVAGGGGGGGGDFCATAGIAFSCGDAGGAGGGLTGAAGNANECGIGLGGKGGTPIVGGAGSLCDGTGGAGAAGTGANVPATADVGSGAGGGGWYGGGSGSEGAGGGGGSSYTNPTYTTSVIHTQGYNCANGQAIISVACNAGTITSTTLSVCQGSTIALTDATTGGTWSSSNTAVGTVSTTGVVYGVGTGGAVGMGTTTIAYTAGGCMVSVIVTVYAEPGAITGTPAVCEGGTAILADAVTGGVWSTVAGSGTISVVGGTVTGLTTPPLAQGTATVSYSFGGGLCAVSTVVTINPVSPILSATPFAVCSGLTISVSDLLAGTWTSSSTSVATVASGATSTTNVITGLIAGTIIVVNTFPSGCSASAILTVNLSPVAISAPPMLCFGNTATLTDGTPGGTWTSSNPGVGSIVSTTGFTTAVSAIGGTTVISYIMPTSCSAETVLTINPSPAMIIGTLAVCTGLTATLTDVTSGGVWSSSNTGALMSGAGTVGTVTGLFSCTSTIAYTLPATGCNATAVMTVNLSPVAIEGNFNMCSGSAVLLTDPSGGGGVWSSSDAPVATIGSVSGIVSPGLSGTSIISYVFTATGCNAATVITVNPSPVPITGTFSSCIGLFTPLADAGGPGVWSSSNTSVATISSSGLVYAATAGLTQIQYSFTSATSVCYPTVIFTVNPSPVAISGTPNICDGLTSTFNDGTPSGTWSSSNTNASVGSSSGVVTGANPGTATIIYTLPTTCFITYSVTITTPPTAIGGSPSVCHTFATILTDGTTPGTWSVSPGSGTATISASGVLTGGSPGGVTVSYVTPACNAVTYSVLVDPLPDPITGIGNLCVGSGTSLTDATTGGTWSSSNTTANVSSTGIVSGVSAGSGTNISYTLPTGCYVVAPVVVFPIPDTIHGLDSVCPGSSIVLTDITPGGVWSSSNGTVAKSIAVTGEVDGLVAGVVNISYTLISGCYVSVPFIVENPLPASLTVTQTPDTATLCQGVPVSFIPHPVNGGKATYQWLLFGGHLSFADTLTYDPTHGDYLTCVMTTDSICASPSVVETNVVVNVYPLVSPVVVISTSSSDIASDLGQVYTFYTNVTFGGPDPAYQWYINSAAVPGATNSIFTTQVYDANDSVYCIVAGNNSPCDTILNGNSNLLIIYGINNLSASALSSTGNDLNLFPNPNTGSFILSGQIGGTANKEVQLEVTDMLGRTAYTGTTTPQNGTIRAEIKLGNDVAAGTYLLRVNTETGTQTFHFVIGK